ncbi:hypothetical protein EN850_12680 [Mesorhizobium sp. M8A.F.Ca.ET.207.01.1.1]|nr:hypothetical protein EN850_12680 [Mesorhizobium sp. M8A.F.Ca.ET.207.01.1.1]
MRIFDLRKRTTWHFPKTRGGVCFKLEGRKRNDACPQALDDIADENLMPQQRLTRIKAQMRSNSLHFLTSRYSEFGGSLSTFRLQGFIDAQGDDMQANGLTCNRAPVHCAAP